MVGAVLTAARVRTAVGANAAAEPANASTASETNFTMLDVEPRAVVCGSSSSCGVLGAGRSWGRLASLRKAVRSIYTANRTCHKNQEEANFNTPPLNTTRANISEVDRLTRILSFQNMRLQGFAINIFLSWT